MRRSTVTLMAAAALLFLLTAGCSKPASSSPAETQAGTAGDLNHPPQAGGAPAKCNDLPSADDLEKWLRAAPGVEGEAGGLFYAPHIMGSPFPLSKVNRWDPQRRSLTTMGLLAFIIDGASSAIRKNAHSSTAITAITLWHPTYRAWFADGK